LAIIEEDECVPPTRDQPRGRSSNLKERIQSNPKSAQIDSEKAKGYLKVPIMPAAPLNGLHESKTPAHSKAKALDILISHQNEPASALNNIRLPKI
jgi:hypothetical protein